MKVSISSTLMLFLIFPFMLFHTSHSATVFMDANSTLKNQTVYIGDTIVFNLKDHYYNLYIFRNEKSFSLCNLTQATLLSKPNSTSFTWHPRRLGYFYFTFINASFRTCQDSKKLALQVSTAAAPPTENAPNSGSATFPWPSLPHQANSPAMLPSEQGCLVPFINSNPAVPLPSSEEDSAAITSLPTSSCQRKVKMEFYIPIVLSSGVLTLLLHEKTHV